MKQIVFFLLISVAPFLATGQQLSLVTALSGTVNETSGLLYLDQRIVTHNDSGGEAALYEIDSATGNVLRKVTVANASIVDWEAICADDTYLYIGDFGNNSGSRTNLKIYRVELSDYLETENDVVTAQSISFSYADQTDFTATSYSTNFDAEAFVAVGNQLYVFTKNWGDGKTNIYPVPKAPGTYQVQKSGSINVQGLVADAAYDPENNTLLLVGYTLLSPFMVGISGFSGANFSDGAISRRQLSTVNSYSWQYEGLALIGQSQYYLTAEENGQRQSALYQLTPDIFTGDESQQVLPGVMYPNPTSGILHIDQQGFALAEIYDLKGSLLKTFTTTDANLTELSQGLYVIVLKNSAGDRICAHRLVVR
ncbi:T9SS type A sorting domain-containing protein [Gaoshiqia sediminis]|uniref:T9SS type A sorting domain-containing protein n=1 Tax=Gaoshiqia sediminis TaxID=2986998 RepID=A0AA41Y6F9_9BACT|nr:T9SS type A sorting domain-containing protein [Gaoshiqia sediminis]MCW0484289.1 T9SS type A sorting domain-containing protein [Gaoshiqia sediminis]